MSAYTSLVAHIERCEGDLARLIRATLDRGALSPGETDQLRHIVGELMGLGRDIEERLVSLRGAPNGLHFPGPASTLH